MSNYTMEYFSERTKGNKWGNVIEDDKYYSDEYLIDNFFVFYVYSFSYLGLPAPTRVQLEIANYIANRDNPHRLVWSARGISKSLTAELYVAWRLLRDPDEKIIVASASSSRAVSFAQFVKKLFSLLPILRPMKPRNNIERVASAAFDVAGSTASDSPSLNAVGVGNNITGARGSLLIIDDVETSITVQSLALTEKTTHAINEMHNLLMSGKDESIVLATPHSQNSMYLDWMDKGTHAFICPARYPNDKSIYMNFLAPFVEKELDDNPTLVGQAIDERLNDDFLRLKELRIGKSNFKLQYMCDVSEADDLKYPLKLSDLIVDSISDEDAPLKIGHSSMPDNMLYGVKHNGFKADKVYAPLYTSGERSEYTHKIISVDPSGKGRDEIGIAIIYTLNTRLFVKKVTGLQGGYEDDNLINICNLCKIHGIKTLVIEENWGGGMFTKMLEPHLRRISNTTAIEEINVRGQKEVRIIETLEPLLNQHRIVIDKDTLEKDKQSLTKNSFTYQLSHITKQRDSLAADDILDAVTNGIQYLLDSMNDDEEFGVEKYIEDELAKIEEVNNRVFQEFDNFYSGVEDELVY